MPLFLSIYYSIKQALSTNRPRSGFSLIELMVAITIVVILSSVGFVSYSNAQKFSRDSKRKQDLKAIAVALEIYYGQNNQYPYSSTPTNGCTNAFVNITRCTSDSGGQWIMGIDSGHINIMPVDPLRNQGDPVPNTGTTYGYGFRSYNTGVCGATSPGQNYILAARLENTSDPDRLGAKPKSFCNGTDLMSVHGFDDDLFIVANF